MPTTKTTTKKTTADEKAVKKSSTKKIVKSPAKVKELAEKMPKDKLITTYQQHAKDTWSAEVQVAIITDRINGLTGHFKDHKKDFHSRVWLVRLVSKRKKLLEYLLKKDKARHETILKKLKLK